MSLGEQVSCALAVGKPVRVGLTLRCCIAKRVFKCEPIHGAFSLARVAFGVCVSNVTCLVNAGAQC